MKHDFKTAPDGRFIIKADEEEDNKPTKKGVYSGDISEFWLNLFCNRKMMKKLDKHMSEILLLTLYRILIFITFAYFAFSVNVTIVDIPSNIFPWYVQVKEQQNLW